MRIVLFTGSLRTGGAERQLSLLAKGLARRGHRVDFFTISPGGTYWDELEREPKIRLRSLSGPKSPKKPVVALQLILSVIRLRREMKSRREPLILHSTQDLANVIAWAASRLLLHVKIAWGIRASNMNYNWYQVIPRKLCAFVSGSVPLLIANSQSGLSYHEALGFRCKRREVIPNGIDTDTFRPDLEARKRIRDEWGIGPEENLIGIAARLDPMKDHANFIRAAGLLFKERRDVRFVFVGDGKLDYVERLKAEAEKVGIGDRAVWAGLRNDMAAVYNAMDIATSSSYGEGFVNAVGEAMACEVPCVVTDVGDSARIVGDTGVVVRPRDPDRLKRGWSELLDRDLDGLGAAARNRVEAMFSLEKFVKDTEKALETLLSDLDCGRDGGPSKLAPFHDG